MANNTSEIQKLYIAYFNRPADPAGLAYWTDQMAHGATLTQVQNSFSSSAEYQAIYQGASHLTLINTLYQNLFGRDGDMAGMLWWSNEMAQGRQTITTIAGALASGTTPGSADNIAINAKIAAATAYTNALVTVEQVAEYSPGAAYEVASAWLSPVVNASTLSAAITTLVATIDDNGSLGKVFTLTESVVAGEAAVAPDTVVYWGYNPHNDHETLDENGNPVSGVPADGGVPLSEMLSFLTSITGLDLTELGLIDDDGVGPFDNVTNLSISNALNMTSSADNAQSTSDASGGAGGADVNNDQSPTLVIDYADGTFREFNIEAQIAESYFKFLNDLLFDQYGNSRLYEVAVPGTGSSGSDDSLQAIKLTPSINNGGTIEQGYTTSGDDTIVAGRLELLHQAYIDGGAGYNVLEIDAKGTYAQPTAVLNVQEIHVNDLPNFYTTGYGSGDGNLGNTLFTGDETIGLTDVPSSEFPEPTGSGSDDSWIDLNRAIDIEKLVVTDQSANSGNLTIVGVRNGATLRLEGGFNGGTTTIQYGQGQTGTLNIELAIGDVTADINLLQNASTLNIDSQGVENHMHQFFAGGSVSNMIITGTGAFGVEEDMDSGFNDEQPILIDASANTGGVNLTLTDSEVVTFLGSQANDRFQVSTDDAGGVVGANGNDDRVTIVDLAGNNHLEVASSTIDITVGDGRNNIELDDNGGTSVATVLAGNGSNNINVASDADFNDVTITVGNGSNTINTDDTDVVTITAGSGDNSISSLRSDSVTITAAGGDNDITVSAPEVAITTGAGNDTITLVGTGNDITGGVGLGSGSGLNLVLVLDGSGSMGFGPGSNLQAQADAVNLLLDTLPADAAIYVVYEYDGMNGAWASKAEASAIANGIADGSIDGTWDTDGFVDQTIAAYADQTGTYHAGGANEVIFITDGGNSVANETVWITFLEANAVRANALGIGADQQYEIDTINSLAYDGRAQSDLDGIAAATAADVSDLLEALGEEITTAQIGNDALINIELGAGQNTIYIGDHTEGMVQGLTAMEGSSISGSNITLFINTVADLRAAELNGITKIVLDDDYAPQEGFPKANDDGERALLTLLDTQVTQLVTEGVDVSVQGSIFNTSAHIKIIVTGNLDMTTGAWATWLSALPVSVDLMFEINDGATLKLTAQQLHTNVTAGGVSITNDGNTDAVSGKVYITGAGLNFDPFNSSDQVRTTIDGREYIGGSLATGTLGFATDLDTPADGIQRDEWGFNVLLDRTMLGYNRPADAPSYSRLTINTDEQDGSVGPFATIETFLRIVGDDDMAFVPVKGGIDEWGAPVAGGTAIELGIDNGVATNDFMVDFSGATGTISNLTLAHFQNVDAMYGNGTDAAPVRVNVEIDDNAGASGDASVASSSAGLVSRGVQTYVVTTITDPTGQDNAAEFWTSRVTEDLQTLGLRGNYADTITFGNTERGVDFLMEVAYNKFDGYAVGTLVADFARPGADAVVNIVGLSTLPAGEVQMVAGIDVTDATSATINVDGGNTVIESLTTDSATTLTLSADANLTIEGDLESDLETIDASGVLGEFTATIDLWEANETPLTFVGAAGSTTLTIDDAADEAIGSISGAGEIALIIGDGTGTDSADLSSTELTNVTSITLQNNVNLGLTFGQLADIDPANIHVVSGGNATLTLTDLGEEPFSVADLNLGVGLSVTSVTILAQETVTLHPDTDLSGIASITIPAGTTLNMTAEQFVQLAIDGGAINGKGTINVTDGTQADVDAALAAIADGDTVSMTIHGDITQGTFELVTDVEMPGLLTGTLGEFEYLIGGNTLTLSDINLADGVAITGDVGSTIRFTDPSEPVLSQIDASGFDVDFMYVLNVLVDDNNVDYMFNGLPERVTKVIYNDFGQVVGREQNVVIQAGTTVPGDLSFNDYGLSTEVTTLNVTLEGGTELDGDLIVSTVTKNTDLIPIYLTELNIVSTGTAINLINGETANVITGDITPLAFLPLFGNSRDNNLKVVNISGDQALVIEGDIIFNSHGSDDDWKPADGITANDDDAAIATLTVDSSADVTIGGINTTDEDVDGLDVINNGTGTLSITIDGDEVETDDALSFTGTGDIELTVVDTEVDLSGDDLSAVTQITIGSGNTDGTLTLTLGQLNTLDLLDGTNTTGDATLNLVEFGSDPFDATALDGDIVVGTITMAAGANTLNPATNLTGVTAITVPAGGTLTLTAAQFQQMAGDGNINALGAGANLFITDLTQADVDAGFDLSDVDGFASVTISLGEPSVDLGTFVNGVLVTGSDAVIEGAQFILADNQTLGLVNFDQADGLDVDGGANTTIVYKFADLGTVASPTPALWVQIDASGYDVTVLKALAASFSGVPDINVEFSIDDLPSSVELRLYADPADLGFLSPTYRSVVIEEGVTTPVGLIFNDWDTDDEVRDLTLTLEGDATLNGDLAIPTRTNKGDDPDTVVVETLLTQFFRTLTINSVGTASNLINGDITTASTPIIPPTTAENSLLNVVINATQDLVINGDIAFNSVGTDGDADTANLTLTGTANVTIDHLDITNTVNDDIDTLAIANNLVGGTLTVLGGTPAVLGSSAFETLTITGTGNTVLGVEDADSAVEDGIDSATVSVIDASGSSGALTIGTMVDIDSADFAFTSGTGVTNVTLKDDSLNSTGVDITAGTADDTAGWNFDFSGADVGSEFHIGALGALTAGSVLNIDLGANTTLYIDASVDLSGLDLSILQTMDIVVADGVTLTLSAEQAAGLTIVGADLTPTGVVNIVNLGDTAVDLSGIDASIAGTITLEDDDVTVNVATDLGAADGFTVVLTDINNSDSLAGQTIRFNTVAQAERDIRVGDFFIGEDTDSGTPGVQAETDTVSSTNVVWLFTSIASPAGVETSGYDAEIGRLWMSTTLINNEGGLIESMFTTLPSSIIRADFGTLSELNVLLTSNEIDRIMEITSFNTVGNLTFSDVGLSPVEHLNTLTLNLGGQVTVGNIAVADVIGAPGYDPASVSFEGITINSVRSVRTGDILATEGYVNDNDGVNETKAASAGAPAGVTGNENALPTNMNTVGNLSVGADNGVDLLTVNLRTGAVTVIGDGVGPNADGLAGAGAALTVGTITYETDATGQTALLDIEGDNNITIAAINTADTGITGLTLDATGFTAVLDPVMNMDDTETLTITNNNDPDGTITLQEVEGNELSTINAVNFDGDLNIVLSQIDSTNDDSTPGGTNDGLLDAFTFTAGQGVTTMTLETVGTNTPQLNTGSEWVFNFTGAAAGSSLTLTDDVVLQAGAILTLVNVPMVIEGDVDLSGVVLNVAATTTIDVAAGQSLTITIDQAKAIHAAGAVVRGEGTTYIVGDGTDNNLGNADWVTDSNIRTVGIDISAVTLDTTLPAPQDADGYFDLDVDKASVPNGLGGYVDAGQNVVGSANNDRILLSSLNDTVTGGLGDDLIDLGTGGADTVVVDAGTDTITGLAADGAGASDDDVLQVTGATATANAVVDTFIATADTSNDGTANLSRGATATNGTIDVSAAGGTNGFNLTGSTNDAASLDALIGSDQDDIINGGNSNQTAGSQDTLTGNGGADVFAFNVGTSIPLAMARSTTTANVDRENIQVTAPATTSASVLISYSLNGVAVVTPLSVAVLAGDTVGVVASKIATAFSGLLGYTAVSIGDTLTVSGPNGSNLEVTLYNANGTGTTATLSEGTDQAQVERVTIGTLAADATVPGETYDVTLVLADGSVSTTFSYTAIASDDAQDVANALSALITASAEFNSVVTVDGGGQVGIDITDAIPDNGGFTASTDPTGGFSGSGASVYGAVGANLAAAGADVITDFLTGTDKIDLDLTAGSLGNYSDDVGVAAATYAAALLAADSALNGVTQYYMTSSTADAMGLLFFDANADGTVDGVVALTGLTSADLTFSDIIA